MTGETVQSILHEAARLSAKGRHEEAEAAYGRALAADPRNYFTKLNYARDLCLRVGLRPAGEACGRPGTGGSGKTDPCAMPDEGERQLLARARGLLESAAAAGDGSGDPDFPVLRGLVELKDGDAEAAERFFLEAAGLCAGSRTRAAFDANNDLGVLYFVTGRFSLAKERFGRALEIDPRDADAWYNLADTCRELGDAEGAARADAMSAKLSR